MSRATILLVEDDALFRETVRETLVSAGYEVLEAADGASGVEQVRQAHPDLVLLDFDLPRLMGDEALGQMLQLRPGLICFVLSGKDDLHQALLMGRRGAYGWIDKFTGGERLLELVAQGLKTRPAGLDLRRLVSTAYPQPIAIPLMRSAQLAREAAPVECLIALRDLYEALVAYLGATYLAGYLDRGLLDDERSAKFWQAIERGSPREWLDAIAATTVDSILPGWLRELTSRLTRPASCPEVVGETARVLAEQVGSPRGRTDCSILDLLRTLAEYHELWKMPDRLPPDSAAAAAETIGRALSHSLGELTPLCELELCVVEQVRLVDEDEYAIQLEALSGVTTRQRQLVSTTPLRQGDLYLISRVTGLPLAPLGPMLIHDRCDSGGETSRGVFSLAQAVSRQRLMYVSHTCGHLRWVDSQNRLEALRHLYFALHPGGNRYGRLAREVAVALVDVSGYTRLTREHGPAVARQQVRLMVAAMRDAAARRGGTLGDPVGDEVLAYFAEPEQAIDAVMEAMRVLAAMPQAGVRLHVGIDFGSGIVERNDVWGDVVNRAKRCQSLAAADEIVVTEEFAHRLDEKHRERLERLEGELKGFGRANVYKVAWKDEAQA